MCSEIMDILQKDFQYDQYIDQMLTLDISPSNFLLFEDFYKIFQQSESLKEGASTNVKHKQATTFKDFSKALT